MPKEQGGLGIMDLIINPEQVFFISKWLYKLIKELRMASGNKFSSISREIFYHIMYIVPYRLVDHTHDAWIGMNSLESTDMLNS
jgi:hypothetical protein